MRIDQLNVVLRARSSWEAMELGTALVRRHAAAIWKPWLLFTLPVFVLLNVGGWLTGQYGLAALLLWWLKPLFERIPLYVISRGVFGDTPTPVQTLRAQWHWGWNGLLGHLLWRRLSPARSLLMPVDMLEGAQASQRGTRRRALGGSAYGHAALLTWVCMAFEFSVVVAAIATIFMFVPVDMLPESVRATWKLITVDPPAWARIGRNLILWAGMSVITPFYVGAGFGLYLNRRTQLEAWDVEITFRRLRERLIRSAPLLLVLLLVLPGGQAQAQAGSRVDNTPIAGAPDTIAIEPEADDTDAHAHAEIDAESVTPAPDQEEVAAEAEAEAEAKAAEEEEALEAKDPNARDPANTPLVIFNNQQVDSDGFHQAVQRAYEDPLLTSSRTESQWKKKPSDKIEREKKERERSNKKRGDKSSNNDALKAVSKFVALLAEWGLWLAVGVLLIIGLLLFRLWLPWMRGKRSAKAERNSPVLHDALVIPEVLPPDLITRARQLWQDGRPRNALALLYRASVETVSERSQTPLPPGATEAQCLRASRRMPDEADRALFARVVRAWQYAAYAARLPSDDEFESLLSGLQHQFRWTR